MVPFGTDYSVALATEDYDVTTSVDGTVHSTNITKLANAAPGTSSLFVASLRGVLQDSRTVSIPLLTPTSIHSILRTTDAYIDRSVVLVAYQLRDIAGSSRVSSHRITVSMAVERVGGGDIFSTQCDTAGLSQANQWYLGYCRIAFLPSSWFASVGTAFVTVSLWHAGTRIATHQPSGTLSLHAPPSWYAAVGGGSSAPTFATLPISPVYAGEEFNLDVYADTSGYALSTFWVWVTLDLIMVQYRSFSQSSLYQTVTLDYGGLQNEVHRFKAVGLQGGTTDAMVTSAALKLLTIQLQLQPAAVVGVNDGIVSIFVRQFINPGSNAFVENAHGEIFDDRAGPHESGRMTIKSVASRGLFLYTATAQMFNFAVLDGQTVTHALTVICTSDRDTANVDLIDVTTASACQAVEEHGGRFSVDACTVQLSATHSGGVSSAVIEATYTNGLDQGSADILTASMTIGVVYPEGLSLTVQDSMLNLIHDANGDTVSVCADSPQLHYQWTTVSATTNGLDATPLVTFRTNNSLVASIPVARLLSNKVIGHAPGSVSVQLTGRPLTFASVSLTVSDTPVSADGLISRVITSVDWVSIPTVASNTFAASAIVRQELTAEGSTGSIFVRVFWNDGTSEDVPYDFAAGTNELNVTSLSPLNLAVGATSALWTATVPVGAVAGCGEMLETTWTICGHSVATARSLVHVNLPNAVAIHISASHSRLASPSDDATATGIDVQSTALITVHVEFDDGSARDMTRDDRTIYHLYDSACAGIVKLDTAIALNVHAGVVQCSSVTLGAFISVYGLTQNITFPIVRLTRLEVSLTGFPDSTFNAGISVTQLGLIDCLTDTYHHATARALAYLSDDTSRTYIVSDRTTFFSSSPTVVGVAGRQMRPLSGGSVIISGRFGSTSSTTNASLEVLDSVISPVTSVTLSTSLTTSQTLLLQRLQKQSTVVDVVFSNGLQISDILAADWLNVESLLEFAAPGPQSAVTIDSLGEVTQHGNWHERVSVTASLKCDSTRFGYLDIAANLHPAEGDVDFGQLTGIQFQQVGSQLAVAVRIQTPNGHRLINFQVSATFDTAYLSSSTDPSAGGTSTYLEGAWSGVESTLNDPPSMFQLVGSNVQSTLSGLVSVGTVMLNVVGSGVSLISGQITELITIDSGGTQHRISSEPVVAGTGYVLLTIGGRRRAAHTLPQLTHGSQPHCPKHAHAAHWL